MAFWLAGDTVRAGMHVNGWDDAEQLERLVTGSARVDADALADASAGWEKVTR
jgi:hypothetical protein